MIHEHVDEHVVHVLGKRLAFGEPAAGGGEHDSLKVDVFHRSPRRPWVRAYHSVHRFMDPILEICYLHFRSAYRYCFCPWGEG